MNNEDFPVIGVIVQPNIEYSIHFKISWIVEFLLNLIQPPYYDCGKHYCIYEYESTANNNCHEYMLWTPALNSRVKLQVTETIFISDAIKQRKTVCDDLGIVEHYYHKRSRVDFFPKIKMYFRSWYILFYLNSWISYIYILLLYITIILSLLNSSFKHSFHIKIRNQLPYYYCKKYHYYWRDAC